MFEALQMLSNRPVVVTLAIIGATMVTAASVLRSKDAEPQRLRLASALHYGGYALTGGSVLLFIVAGFISGR